MMAPLDDERLRSDGKQQGTSATERRQSVRHRLRDAPGTLFWRERGQQVGCAITMVDISGGGAAVLAERAPPVNQSAWIRLETAAAAVEPLEARIVATSVDRSRKHLVRMQFTSGVPLATILECLAERRLWERYPASETRVSLVWLGQGGEQSVPGQLLNISGGGAAIVTDATLPEEQPIWLTLQPDSGAITPVECRLVTISINESAQKIARLRFVEACPIDLYELAVSGAPR
jgi:c-di-GMP-binding flagellar brake protein YcgR